MLVHGGVLMFPQYLYLFVESSFQILNFLIHFIQLYVFTSFAITRALVAIFLNFIELFVYSLNSEIFDEI